MRRRIGPGTNETTEWRDKEGLLAQIARFLLGWLDPEIGREQVVLRRIDRDAVLRSAQKQAERALAAVQEEVRSKVAQVRDMVSAELDEAARRAKEAAEERSRLARSSLDQCEQALAQVQTQQETLRLLADKLERIERTISYSR